jgi:hypothetical protein
MTTCLRKLGAAELVFDASIAKCHSMTSRAFRIDTKIDIYSSMNLFSDALIAWKEAHHLLRCHVVRDADGDKCFAYAPDHILNSQENLKFLRYNKGYTDDIWKLFLEKELATPMDSSRLLWRLILVQVGCSTLGTLSYLLIFTAHHAITQGTIVPVVHLFSFLERLHLGLEIQVKPYELLPSVEQHLQVIQYKQINSTIKSKPIAKHMVPETIVNQNYEPFSAYNADEEGTFFTHDNKFFTTYKDMVQQNKDHFTTVQALVFNADITQRLLQKCKNHKSKLSGSLQMILVLATQEIFKRFNGGETEGLYYSLAVSLRPFLDPPIESNRMGHCSKSFKFEVHEFIDTSQEDFWSLKFWHYAKIESDEIHDRIAKQEYFNVGNIQAMNQVSSVDACVRQCKFHFKLSNRGDMTSVLTTENQIFKFVESFSGNSFSENNQTTLFGHYVESLNGQLFWSWGYNKNILKQDVASFYMKFIDNAVASLVA